MKRHTWMLPALVAMITMGLAGSEGRASTVFGTVDGFESDTAGTLPANWFDGTAGWAGGMTVVTSGTDGINAKSGNQFAKITPGAPDSFQAGYQDAPYGHIGSQQANPSPGGWSIFIDIFAQAGASAGSLWWTNGVTNSSDGSYLTESGFQIETGASDWTFTTTAGGQPSVTVATGAWYTMEVTFTPSGSTIDATHKLFNASGTELYSDTLATAFNPSVTDFGGPRYSWFTVWDNNGPSAVYVDNAGTAAVPLPASAWGGLALLGCLGLANGAKRLRRQEA